MSDAGQAIEDAVVNVAFSVIGNLTKNYTTDPATAAQMDADDALVNKYFKGMTPEEAKKEYHRLARANHSDLHAGQSDEAMKEINRAWNAYKDRIKASGTSAYQVAEAAKASGDTAAYKRATADFVDSVNGLQAIVETGGIAKVEVADALQILNAVSTRMQSSLPAAGAPTLPRTGVMPSGADSKNAIVQSAETQDAALLLKYTMEAQGEKTSGQEDPDGGMITKIGSSTKEGWKDGEQREETREDFTQRCAREGLRSVEGKTAVFGYRETGDIHPQEAAGRQVQKELKDLGLASVVMDGTLWINKNGLSVKQFISEAATIPGELIIINSEVGTLPRETAGHEAFHFLYGTRAREKYVEVLQGSLDYSSQAFRDYQDSFVRHYFDGAVDISDIKQLQLFQEELFAYISGDIHEGGHEDVLRRMLWDYDAVKTAWEAMVQEQRGQGGISESIDAQDAPLLIKRELRKIAQTEEAAKAVPLLKKYMLVLPEDGGLKQRGLGDRVAEAMQKDLKERGRTEEESKPLWERLAQVQAEGEAGLAKTWAQYEKAVAERETETVREKDGETAEQSKTELTKSDVGSKASKRKSKVKITYKLKLDDVDIKDFALLKEYDGEIRVVDRFAPKEYVVELEAPRISGVRGHFRENLSKRSDRANLTEDVAQSIIDSARLVLYQPSRGTLKFLSNDGYVVLNMLKEVVTVVPEKLRNKYRRYIGGDLDGEKN